MTILFSLGLMSLLWMALVRALVIAEKVLTRGWLLPRLLVPALLGALGIWVALASGSVPA